MNLQAALVLGACLAAGSALAQATPSEDDAFDAGEPARTGIRWRWEASPSQRMVSTHIEPRRAAPGVSTPIDYRLWVGDRRTEFGIGLLPAAPHADAGRFAGAAKEGQSSRVIADAQRRSARRRPRRFHAPDCRLG